jgi:hypothetical protein
MLSVPGAKTVRGYSFFGDSFVYVIFEDGTDLYWARSRVLEYLNQVQGRLPASARSALGPDATGVGWVYEYALVDRTGRHDLSQLRGLQDWFLRYELKTVTGVAEVASIGGMVKQYQVLLDPVKLAAYGVTHAQAVQAISQANQEAGGSVLEMAEAEYMVRASGYLKTLDDFRAIPLKTAAGGVPVRLGDVATIQVGPEMRRGIAELNGEGEVAGGVVILRSGKNARETIAAVKDKLADLRKSLPPGVEVVTVYDRSQLIDRAVENLTRKLVEEFIVVALVCALFLWHVRSALVAILTLPLGVLAAFVVMRFQGERQHHVAGRHRHRHRRDGGCGGRHDRERPQEDRTLGAGSPGQTSRWRDALDRRHRGGGRGRAGAVLQPADHHAVVHSGLHPGGAGRPAVRAARLHQDLCDGRGRDPVGDPGADPDGLADPGPHSGRAGQSGQSLAHQYLPARDRLDDEAAQGSAADRGSGVRHHGLAAQPARRRVHAQSRRGRPALHALGAAGPLGRQGE